MCCEGPFGELVEIADIFGDPLFGQFHRLPALAFSLFTLSALEQMAISRLIGDSPTGLDDLQAFISLFFLAALFLLAM
ncbi:hypothetical protein H5410_046516 [Solanum commersonii]|uniref:Uncharacterized protein n=1 Tax=Solanum commersonii TaxID=4109 RepID=A0A9J5XEH2_SOLCO|nr:hypothetical protein H5410_046516 [Solanum commersonii]